MHDSSSLTGRQALPLYLILKGVDMFIKANMGLATYHAALGLPTGQLASLEKQVEKWVEKNGIEWTVNRCKTLYTDFVRYRAGLPSVGKWYAKNSNGLPKGIYSYFFRTSVRSKKHRFACGVALRMYTRYISSDTTGLQMSKWLSGVTSSPTSIPSEIVTGVIEAGLKAVGRIVAVPLQPSFISYTPSPGKRVPLSNGKTAPEETHWTSQWETLRRTKTGRRLSSKYPLIFQGVMSGFQAMLCGKDHMSLSDYDIVGKIGLIQEPGFKLRAVANPNRVYQVALKPLGDAIYDILKGIPWDCTHQQDLGFSVIQQHLQQNKRCHCLDLSGATDYFPLSLQVDLLSQLLPGHKDYIDLFVDLSRSDWALNNETIKWTKGQPLGLYPSFGAFALTHGMLLYYLNNFKHNNAFFVLGDDVIIMDDSLALRYIKCLKALECPISESKSITSAYLAEFGGKLISKDVIEPQLKWKHLSDDNFVDIMKLLGPHALRLLRPQQRKVVKAIWDIPDFVGGIGFNPEGLPLSVRYEKYLTLFDNDVGAFLMSYDRKFNSFFNEEVVLTSNLKSSQYWDSTKLPDLDQRSASLALKYLPRLATMYGILGTNLYTVSLDKGELPIDGVNHVARSTLLSVLRRKLGM